MLNMTLWYIVVVTNLALRGGGGGNGAKRL